MVDFSPKRSRRDEKDEKDRVLEQSKLEGAQKTDQEVQDQKQRRRLQDALPLESPLGSNAKVESGAPRKVSDTKPSGHQQLAKNSSDPTEVPRPRSYFQVLCELMIVFNLFHFVCLMCRGCFLIVYKFMVQI